MIEIGVFIDSQMFRGNYLNHRKFSLDPFIKKSGIEWFNPLIHEKEITVFTDYFLDQKLVKNHPSKLKIIILMEPIETGVWNYRKISLIEPFVDLILTFDDLLLRKYKKAKPYVPGGTFIGSKEFLPINEVKNKLVSIVASKKKDTFGHKLRHEIISQFNPEFNINAFGTGYIPFEKRLEPYANFAFTIVIENVKNSYLLTEKLIDPILHKTIPIYWGGDIENDFDSKGIFSFQTLEQLREILHDISFEKYNELRNPVSVNQAKAINLLSKEINIEKSIRKNLSLGSEENFDYSKSNVRDFLSGKSPLQSLSELGDFAVTTMSLFPGVDIETDTFSRLKFWIKRKLSL
jgi:hypothetical protein